MFPMNILEDFRPKLDQFNKITEPEMNAIISGSKHKSSKQELGEITDLKNELNKIIECIAKSGEMCGFEEKF